MTGSPELFEDPISAAVTEAKRLADEKTLAMMNAAAEVIGPGVGINVRLRLAMRCTIALMDSPSDEECAFKAATGAVLFSYSKDSAAWTVVRNAIRVTQMQTWRDIVAKRGISMHIPEKVLAGPRVDLLLLWQSMRDEAQREHLTQADGAE